jgi:hypothetical protein
VPAPQVLIHTQPMEDRQRTLMQLTVEAWRQQAHRRQQQPNLHQQRQQHQPKNIKQDGMRLDRDQFLTSWGKLANF